MINWLAAPVILHTPFCLKRRWEESHMLMNSNLYIRWLPCRITSGQISCKLNLTASFPFQYNSLLIFHFSKLIANLCLFEYDTQANFVHMCFTCKLSNLHVHIWGTYCHVQIKRAFHVNIKILKVCNYYANAWTFLCEFNIIFMWD